MKQVIYKYPLNTAKIQTVPLPYGARILTVQVQNGVPYLWALIDPNVIDIDPATIEMIATGELIEVDYSIIRKYISTIQLYNGALVYHVFVR